jgi:hypothetical protein
MKAQLHNRRQFIATAGSALTAAALTSPLALTAAVDRTWRVAVIGHTKRGDYGHGLDVMWQRIPRVEIVAVADADATGLAAARRRLGGVKGFGDYGKMLAETKPDIVAITPRHVDQHHAMCLASIAGGARAIYLEKPFCRSPREADDIVAAGTEKNVKIAVAHRNRYHPVLPVINQLLAAGEIGTLLEIRTRGKEDARGGAQDLWVLGSHLFNLAAFSPAPRRPAPPCCIRTADLAPARISVRATKASARSLAIGSTRASRWPTARRSSSTPSRSRQDPRSQPPRIVRQDQPAAGPGRRHQHGRGPRTRRIAPR